METRITLDSKQVEDGLKKAPSAVGFYLEQALDRGALEIARLARDLAPKAFSTLANSIRSIVTGKFQRTIAPGVNYALPVETGRKPGRMPGTNNGLAAWVRQKTGFTGDQLDRVTFLIARSIARKGIKPKRFMQPAAEQKQDRVRTLVSEAVAKGLQEAFR